MAESKDELKTLFSWAPKSLWTLSVAIKLKDTCSLEEKLCVYVCVSMCVCNLNKSNGLEWPDVNEVLIQRITVYAGEKSN